jgi:imidazolonepropionase-like amidohydrolase
MLDVSSGTIVANPVLLVEGERILSVGSEAAVPPDARVIDLGDVTILPGLIDAHTHITYHFDENGMFGVSRDPGPEANLRYAEENARLTLDAGFTTIRNLGDSQGVDIRLRDRIKSGEAEGPRMLVSGPPLTADIFASRGKRPDRLEIIRQFVKARIAQGVDVIKIFEGVDAAGQPILSSAEIRAAVEVAKQAGLKVAVHANEAAAVIAAVEGGCDSVEHGTFLNYEAIESLVKNRVALVPTLYLPTYYLEHKKQFTFGDSTWAFFESLKARNQWNLRAARQAGVRVVNGSDAVAGMHGRNAREMIWLKSAGMRSAAVIRAATIDAADLLGLSGQVGDIKAGFFADIIAVPGDPLKDIGTLERVTFVMKSGRVIKSNL